MYAKTKEIKLMQKKKKVIIVVTILALIILAIILLIKNTKKQMPQALGKQAINNYTTQIGNETYDITNLIQDPKDITPTLSAGMIPVKMDGDKWIITDKNQEDWYDYSEYKPAYMMLNDGVYQSEVIRNMDQKGKKLASENLGVEIKQEELGTIYMWVPRFAYDENTRDIELLHIKQECAVLGNYRISGIFTSEADKWDYSYAGAWIEYEPLASEAEVTTKVNNLNKGENDEIYGFLANTKAYTYNGSFSYFYCLEYYICVLSEKNMVYTFSSTTDLNNVINNTNIIKNLNNYNRTVLRVSETNKLEPIKATSYYDTVDGKIIIEITHNKNEIKQVLFDNGEKLEFTTTNGKTIANTGDIEILTKRYIVTIIDVDGNAYRFTAYGEPIYATLYTDGTLGLSTGKTTISGKAISKSYGDIQLNSALRPWANDVSNIKTVNIVNKIRPTTIAMWFYNCTNLTAISNIANLDTSKVTSMASMFNGCSSLRSLDLSNFDTSKVTQIGSMFYGCSSLRSLDLSSFDTSQVTSMGSMFSGCSNLTSLNLSSFDTSKVTSMNNMFSRCSSLTSLNLSNFDTSKVTSMSYMFQSCSALRSLNISNFDTSNITNMYAMFDRCSALTSLNISSFDTSNVTSMGFMFSVCSSLTSLDLSSFNVSKVTDFSYMFQNCSKLKTIYVNKSTSMWSSSIKNSTSSSSPYYNMFLGCGTSTVTRK